VCIAGVNSTKHPASNAGNVGADVTSRGNARIGMRVVKFVCAVGAVKCQ
jgi:hypothetical protein